MERTPLLAAIADSTTNSAKIRASYNLARRAETEQSPHPIICKAAPSFQGWLGCEFPLASTPLW
jgi:hypothetical protein